MKKSVNLFGSLDGYDVLNIGWQNVGGRYVSYGDRTPSDDPQGEWFLHHTGDLRLYVGSDSTILGWRCSVDGTPGTWIELLVGSSLGGMQVFESIGQMQATAFPRNPTQIYFCKGYAGAGDNGGGFFTYRDDIASFDDAFTFAPTVGPGAFKRALPGVSEFTLPMGGIFSSAVTPQGVAFSTLYDAVVAANTTYGYGIINVRIPENFDLVVTDGIVVHGDGPNVLGSGRTSRMIGTPLGSNAAGFSIFSTFVSFNETYVATSWTQDLTTGAGQISTDTMDSIDGLAAGQDVCVRYGADPSDQVLAYWYHFTKIVSVDGESNTVTFASPLPDNVPAGVGINTHRLSNKHDILVLDRFCNGFKCGNFSTFNVHVNNQFCVDWEVFDIHVEHGVQCFSATYDTNTYAHDLTSAMTTNNPGGGIFAWFFQGWSHTNFKGERLWCEMVGSNFFSQEGQNRETVIDDTRVQVGNSDYGALTLISLSSGPRFIRYHDMQVTGLGNAFEPTWDEQCQVDGLYVSGYQPGVAAPGVVVPLSCLIQGRQITGRLFFRGCYWERVVQAKRMSVPLIAAAPAGSRTMDIPLSVIGIPRRIGIRATTLTGISTLIQNDTYTNFDLLPGLTAGSFIEQPGSTLLGGNYPGGYGNGLNTPNAIHLHLVTQDTMPAGQMLEIDSEFWVSELDTWKAAQLPETVPVSVPPTANAQFIGQQAYNPQSMAIYRAISVGFGAADWLLVNPMVPIYSAPFVGVPNVAVSFPAGAYRHLKFVVHVKAGGSTYVRLSYTGPAAGDYYTSNLGIASAASSPSAAANFFNVDLSADGLPPGMVIIDGWTSTDGGQRDMVAIAAGGNGNGQVSSGVLLDSANDITGALVAFSTNCDGYLEVFGYP